MSSWSTGREIGGVFGGSEVWDWYHLNFSLAVLGDLTKIKSKRQRKPKIKNQKQKSKK
jgi:hypothetical protein